MRAKLSALLIVGLMVFPTISAQAAPPVPDILPVDVEAEFAGQPVTYSFEGLDPGEWYLRFDVQPKKVRVAVEPPAGMEEKTLVSLDTGKIFIETPLYPVLQLACETWDLAPTSEVVSCSVDPEYGWDPNFKITEDIRSSRTHIGYLPFTNWHGMILPFDLQFGTRSSVNTIAYYQENTSKDGWTQPVMVLTPPVRPFVNSTPDVALNFIAYPEMNVTTSSGSGDPWNRATHHEESSFYKGLESEAGTGGEKENKNAQGKTIYSDSDNTPPPESTQPKDSFNVRPSTARAPVENERSQMAQIIASVSAALLALLLAVLWLLRTRKIEKGSPVAQHIVSTLAETPGMSVCELETRLGVSNPTISYHLHRLTKEGKVIAHGSARRRRFFLAQDQLGRREKELLAQLRHPLRAKIFQAVHSLGGVTKARLASTLQEDPYTTAYHTQALVKAGVLQTQPNGRSVRLTLDPRYHAAAERIPHSPAFSASTMGEAPTMQTG